jgi:hypothetical protein
VRFANRKVNEKSRIINNLTFSGIQTLFRIFARRAVNNLVIFPWGSVGCIAVFPESRR